MCFGEKKEILMAYQACDKDIQRDMLDSNAVGDVAKLSLQKRQGERKKRVEEILNACYDRRGHVELPEASDIFLDIMNIKMVDIDVDETLTDKSSAQEKKSNSGKGDREDTLMENGEMCRSYKLDARTPVFKSSPEEDIETWLFKMETALKFASVPENLWLIAVTNYVEGTAFEIVMAARMENRSWSYVKEQLVKTFRSVLKDFNLRSKILSLKDEGNYEKYLHEFRSLSNQINNTAMSEKDKLACFMQGLRPKTRVELFLKKVETLEEAILVASSIESVWSVPTEKVNEINYIDYNSEDGKSI